MLGPWRKARAGCSPANHCTGADGSRNRRRARDRELVDLRRRAMFVNGTAYPAKAPRLGLSFRGVQNMDVLPAASRDGFTASRNDSPTLGAFARDMTDRS